MDQRQQRIEEKLDNKEFKGNGDRRESSTNRNCDKHFKGSHNSLGAKVAKLEFPKYNGTDDSTTWICWVKQYFDFKQIEEVEKLPLVAYHLDGESQMWYQLFKDSKEVLTWDSLKAALHVRYRSTIFKDHFNDLMKLQQARVIRDYQFEFEQLLNRVEKLSVQQQLGCFVSGLKNTLRTEVQATRPKSVMEAIGLARLYKTRNGGFKKISNP
jgi:hypothetical protein